MRPDGPTRKFDVIVILGCEDTEHSAYIVFAFIGSKTVIFVPLSHIKVKFYPKTRTNLRSFPWTSILSTMRSTTFIWCTVVLYMVLSGRVCHGALDDGEKGALGELLSTFPNLASIATSEFVVDGKIDYGRSWTNDFGTYCLNGDGYEYYGLYCSNGHIGGIVLYVHFSVLPQLEMHTNDHCPSFEIDLSMGRY